MNATPTDVWLYTVKSVGGAVLLAVCAYYVGKRVERRAHA